MQYVLLERAVVLKRVDELLARVGDRTTPGATEWASRAGPVLVVRGVAGVGKTSVLLEAADRARAAQWAVRFCPTSPGEHDWPYSGLDQVMRSLKAADLSGAGALLSPQQVAARVLDVLAIAAKRAPLAVIVDDVQWLDEASARCLAFVIRRATYDPILFLLGRRDELRDQVSAADPGLVDGQFDDAPEIRLDMLSRDGAVALAREEGASGPVADTVADHCGGLPLAVTQVVGALSPGQRLGHEPLPSPMPESTPELVYRHQLQALGDAACLAAAAAATCTGMAAPALRSVLIALGVAPALEVVERQGLLAMGAAGPTWVHPLAQAAALATVPAQALRRIRVVAADSLAQEGANADTVTWLRVDGADGPSEQLAVDLEAVARRAKAVQAHRAAADAWDRAAQIGTQSSHRGPRLARAASERILAGTTDLGMSLGHQALDAGLGARDRWKLLVDMGRAAATSQGPGEALELLGASAQAAAEAGDGRGHVLALVEALDSVLYLEEPELVQALAQRAYAEHDPADPYQVFLAHAATGLAALNAERVEEGQRALESALLTCERTGLLEEHCELTGTAARVVLWSTDWRRLRAELLAALTILRHEGDLAAVGQVLRRLAWCDFHGGQQESAGRLATEAVDLARDVGRPIQLVTALTTLAAVEGIRGNAAVGAGFADEARTLALSTKSLWLLSESIWAQTFAYLSAGDASAAATAAEPLADLLLAERRATWEPEYFDVVVAMATGGRTRLAGKVREVLVRYFADSPRLEVSAGAALAAAALGTADPAALEELADRTGAAGLRLWQGRLLLASGVILSRRGERGPAQQNLHAAVGVFERFGALAWAERANVELRASGVTVRSGWSEPLTGAELRVVRAVAQGMKNTEVAAALFVSPKTVEFHLGRIYRKLGIRNRSELVRSVLSGGLDTGSQPAAPSA